MEPIIATIVSNRLSHCHEFIRKYRLNPVHFKCVAHEEQLHGVSADMPIILIYDSARLPDDMLLMIKSRFKSVRYMDY